MDVSYLHVVGIWEHLKKHLLLLGPVQDSGEILGEWS